MTAKMPARASYRGHTDTWVGVVRDADGKIIAECGHIHRNRDGGSRTWGPPARTCAMELLREIDPDAWFASLPEWQQRGLRDRETA